MSGPNTIRERIERASAFFKQLEAVVLTTFNLGTTFLEDHALPAALGVDAKTTVSRHAELHQRLGAIPCSVYYDPSTAPRISGRFRYVARPVPRMGRFFHPKLVVLAGKSEVGTTWVYLAVSSANLTLSGWGRNAESFGETWIHTRQQQPWRALDQFLEWLQDYAPLNEQRGWDAASCVRAALARMPDRKRFADDGTSAWSGALYAELYSSVVNKDGFPAFLNRGRSRRPKALWAYSPYWSDVAGLIRSFNAHRTVLVPALRVDGAGLGLSQEQATEIQALAEVQRNPDDGTKFWHMKAYWVQHTSTIFTAVGSCNFTAAGLSGGSANVEAMLVFQADPEWLPEGDTPKPEDYSTETQFEEGVPKPSPVAIVVAWDWRGNTWRWWLEPGREQTDFVLRVPGHDAFSIGAGSGSRPGKAPPRGATFELRYRERGVERPWEGQVVELNLDHSERTYGRPLTAAEILDSWRGRAPTWDIGGGGSGDGSDPEDDIEAHKPAAFDAVNLYDLYRSMRALRSKLSSLGAHPEIRRAYLVGRPDSVMTLAQAADREEVAPIVRYLVLRELASVMTQWRETLDATLVDRVQNMAGRVRERTQHLLIRELGGDAEKTDSMLDWFEEKLAAMDGEAGA